MAALAGLVPNVAFGFIHAYVFLAVFRAHPGVTGWTSHDALTYVWVTQGLLTVVYVWTWEEVALRIRSGDVAVDLQRPLDFQGYWFASDLGRAVYHLLYRGIPPLAIGAVLFSLRLPSHAYTWPLFVVSVGLAVCVGFSLRFLANLPAFWLLDYRGAIASASVVWWFFSGMIVPLGFFPGPLHALALALPFAALIQVPVEVFLEQRQGGALLVALLVQAAWAVALLLAGRAVLGAAVRRLVVQGG